MSHFPKSQQNENKKDWKAYYDLKQHDQKETRHKSKNQQDTTIDCVRFVGDLTENFLKFSNNPKIRYFHIMDLYSRAKALKILRNKLLSLFDEVLKNPNFASFKNFGEKIVAECANEAKSLQNIFRLKNEPTNFLNLCNIYTNPVALQTYTNCIMTLFADVVSQMDGTLLALCKDQRKYKNLTKEWTKGAMMNLSDHSFYRPDRNVEHPKIDLCKINSFGWLDAIKHVNVAVMPFNIAKFTLNLNYDLINDYHSSHHNYHKRSKIVRVRVDMKEGVLLDEFNNQILGLNTYDNGNFSYHYNCSAALSVLKRGYVYAIPNLPSINFSSSDNAVTIRYDNKKVIFKSLNCINYDFSGYYFDDKITVHLVNRYGDHNFFRPEIVPGASEVSGEITLPFQFKNYSTEDDIRRRQGYIFANEMYGHTYHHFISKYFVKERTKILRNLLKEGFPILRHLREELDQYPSLKNSDQTMVWHVFDVWFDNRYDPPLIVNLECVYYNMNYEEDLAKRTNFIHINSDGSLVDDTPERMAGRIKSYVNAFVYDHIFATNESHYTWDSTTPPELPYKKNELFYAEINNAYYLKKDKSFDYEKFFNERKIELNKHKKSKVSLNAKFNIIRKKLTNHVMEIKDFISVEDSVLEEKEEVETDEVDVKFKKKKKEEELFEMVTENSSIEYKIPSEKIYENLSEDLQEYVEESKKRSLEEDKEITYDPNSP